MSDMEWPPFGTAGQSSGIDPPGSAGYSLVEVRGVGVVLRYLGD